MQPNIIYIEPSERELMIKRLEDMPDINFKSDEFDPSAFDIFWREVNECNLAKRMRKQLEEDLYHITGRGYVIFQKLLPRISAYNINHRLKLPTLVCCLLGRPIKVMDKLGLWLDVPVKLEVAPYKFGGVGYIPFHIDVVNSTNPPDLVAFVCERNDPLGGGQTVVSNLQLAINWLSDQEKKLLQKPVFKDGMLFNMSEVGLELNPFPILQKTNDNHWKVRFTAKMLNHMESSPEKDVVERLEKLLIQNQESFLLDAGQLIIINQNIIAHGRLKLGDAQETLSASNRRLLHQMYMRIPNI